MYSNFPPSIENHLQAKKISRACPFKGRNKNIVPGQSLEEEKYRHILPIAVTGRKGGRGWGNSTKSSC